MTRKTLILLWMLLPIAVAAYHFNFGPKQIARERAYVQLQKVRQLHQVEQPDWIEIIDQYNRLAEMLPPDEDPRVRLQIRLATCEARIEMLDLQTAIEELTALLQQSASEYGENAPLTRAVREQLGKSHYYATWVLKTNGAPESEWRPYAERARQLFRYLAELENPSQFQRYEQRAAEQFRQALVTAN